MTKARNPMREATHSAPIVPRRAFASNQAPALPDSPGLSIDLTHAEPSVDRQEALTRFLAQLRAAGLPEPEVQRYDNSERVDLVWHEHRLVVRIDDSN